MEHIKSIIEFLYYYPDGPAGGGNPFLLVAIGIAYFALPVWMNYEIARRRGRDTTRAMVLAGFSGIVPVPFVAYVVSLFFWILLKRK